ncbi:MAG: outer membrane protein transport protein [Thermoguttaceae bacterium]|jgi:long-subunit fatty acid transport protein
MSRKWIPLVLCGIFLTLASTAWADGLFLNGLSPRSIGRGGTNLAYADNGAILFDNPAGAVNIDGNGLMEFGVDAMFTDFHYANALNDASDRSMLPLPQISLIRKSADGMWAYGLGLFVPAGFSETYDLQTPLFGEQRYKSFGSLMKVLPGAACRLTDRLTVGATLGVGISHEELEGPYFLQNPGALQGTPTLLDLQATGATLCWSVGLQYQLTEATTLGLTYQSESRFELDGTSRVTVPGYGASAFDTQMDVTWPRSLGLGVRHALCPWHIISADVIWYDWSRSFDDFGIHLSNPSNLMFPAIYEQFPLRWHDTASVRLGYEWILAGGSVVRVGYDYHRNPVPVGTLSPYIQATLEHAFSLGYGWTWNSWDIDLAYMFTFGPNPTVETSDWVGGDFNQSTNKAQTHCFGLSLIRRF